MPFAFIIPNLSQKTIDETIDGEEISTESIVSAGVFDSTTSPHSNLTLAAREALRVDFMTVFLTGVRLLL